MTNNPDTDLTQQALEASEKHRLSVDDEGFIIVSSICNISDNEGWLDQFIGWYEPDGWANSRRAACSFIAKKLLNTPPKPLNDAQIGDLNQQGIPSDDLGSGALINQPSVDVEALIKPTTQTNPFLEIESNDIQNYKAHGWNECLIYLQSQGHLPPSATEREQKADNAPSDSQMIPKGNTSEWQPIETAPKDGAVLCYDNNWSEEGIVLAEDYGLYWQVFDRDDDTTHFRPTHWMPLPQPPTQGDE